MNWNKIESQESLSQINLLSEQKDVLIFKHSTRCSISAMALGRLERKWNETETQNLKPFYLDLLNFRPLSNQIAEFYGIQHQSPQVLIIKKGKCVYSATHSDISYETILEHIQV
jgi:bacillithiol system protein YtxJ